MTEEQLKEIEARANAATPGPWKVEWDYNGLRVSEGESKEDYWDTFANDDVDLPFMGHAREDIPNLLAEVRRLRALIKQVQQVEGDFGDRFCPWCGCHIHDDCPAFTPEGDVR